MAEAGVGAVVLPSLFEEQLVIDRLGMGTWVKERADLLPGKLKHFPDMSNHNEGVANYLTHIFGLKQLVDVPIIASLNGASLGGWIEYASLLEGAGADALELNLFDLPTRPYPAGADLIANYRTIIHAVVEKVDIPVAVKISPFFASIPNVVMQFVEAGARGCILFNRFYQPDIDLETEELVPNLELSNSSELRLRLRWAAILYDQIAADIAITGGVHTDADLAKSILVGAQVVTIAPALLQQGIDVIKEMNDGLKAWMKRKNYRNLAAFRGKLSQEAVGEAAALVRANYIRVLDSYLPDSE